MIDVGYEVELQRDVFGIPAGSIGTVVGGGSRSGLIGGTWQVEFPDPDGPKGDVKAVTVPENAMELA